MEKKIIVVDDSPTFLMYVGLLLKRLNYRVIPAGSGMELLKLLKLGEPDAVLLDVQMPVMNGLKALGHIKGDKQTENIPVIMMTSDGSDETIKKCKALGCHAYLKKPIKIDELHVVMEACLFSHKGTSRKHLRKDFIRKLPVTFREKNYEFYTETLSQGGLYLRTREPFPIGAEVELMLPLDGRAAIPLKGKVIYTKNLYGDFLNLPPGMAIQFMNLTDKEKQEIKGFVEDLLAKDILESQEERVIEK